MSADLLAEFDAYYRAPKQGSSNIASDGLSELTSGPNDLSIFNQSSATPVEPEITDQYSSQKYDITKPNRLDDFNLGEANIRETEEDFDIWGEFESPVILTTTTQTSTPQGSTKQFNDGLRNTGLENKQVTDESRHCPATATADSHGSFLGSSDAFLSSAKGLQTKYSSSMKPISADSVPAVLFASNSNVLFDVDNVSDDNEFGDFETVTTLPEEQQPSRNPSDSSTTAKFNNTENPPYLDSRTHQLNSFLAPKVPKSVLSQEGVPFGKSELDEGGTGALKQRDPTSFVKSPYNSSGKSNIHQGRHIEISNERLPVKARKPSSSVNDSSWDWDSVEIMPTNETRLSATKDPNALDVIESHLSEVQISSSNSPPPTNIPPPSVLLTLFPHLLDLSQSSLFQPVASQPFSLKNRILSDPSTIDFMRAYILLATVAGRIIAGRKSRWKRDTHLSQSMKIGPAAARGKSGMKLAGVDKAEISREDREADEFVRTWKDQVGRLRSAVAVANSSISGASEHLIVPEISDTMLVHTASSVEGAFTAPRPCFICGLKRDERISKVDLQVEDSFGEWWVEHWGHKACRNFWLEQNSKLKHG